MGGYMKQDMLQEEVQGIQHFDARALDKRKKKRKRLRMARLLKVLAFIVIAVSIALQVADIIKLHNEKVHLEQQVEDLQQKKESLEAEKQKLSDPKNIEGVARDELGLVKPGEVPYVK